MELLMLSELEKQRAWQIYVILIQQNSTFADNQRHCKELAKTALNIVESFNYQMNEIENTLSPLKEVKEEIKSNV
jgi:predicted esterase YcpF (UPF0227 family)